MAFASLGDGLSQDNFITGIVPGGEPMKLDNGTAYRIPARSVLGLEIHLVTTGKPESAGSRSACGTRGRPWKSGCASSCWRTSASPSPAAPGVPIKAGATLDADAVGFGLFSHMHLPAGNAFTASRPTPARRRC